MALIFIDFQKEFFKKGGILKKKHFQTDTQIADVLLAYDYAKSNNMMVIFVRSDYQEQKQDEKYPTHRSKNKCCVGENGDFIDEINNIIEPDDIIIIKKYYSCFDETSLNNILKERNINQIFISGLTINNCIKHSAIRGAELGYEVILVKNIIMHRQGDEERNKEKFEILAKIKNIIVIDSLKNQTDEV